MHVTKGLIKLWYKHTMEYLAAVTDCIYTNMQKCSICTVKNKGQLQKNENIEYDSILKITK